MDRGILKDPKKNGIDLCEIFVNHLYSCTNFQLNLYIFYQNRNPQFRNKFMKAKICHHSDV